MYKNLMAIDLECIKRLFTFQFRNKEMEKAKMFEAYNDEDIKRLYGSLIKANLPMYCYSIHYDKAMINALFKLVEKGQVNIVDSLKRINDYFIIGGINYFRLNREVWVDNYFKNLDKYENQFDVFKYSIEKVSNKYYENPRVGQFLHEFSYLLGQSNNFRKLNIIEIPKMLYFYTIRKDGIIRPSISLKNIQLYEEGWNHIFDFENMFDLDEIIEAGMMEDFRKYSLNDVDFLWRYIEKKCIPILKQRYYACKAIQKFNSFEFDERMIHSENNTNLLISAFSNGKVVKEEEEEEEENKENDEFYNTIFDNIKQTGYDKFDKLVEFVQNNNDIKKDKDLKEEYCDYYEKEYDKTDEKTIQDNGKIQIVVGKFDEFELFGTKVTTGLGGIHGAIERYIAENLWHLDYESLYPSIILQFYKYYGKIINIELYKGLYEYRNNILKPRLKQLDKEIADIYQISEKSGITAELEEKLNKLETEYQEVLNLSNGSKLLLNSLYGILNSEFNFSISNKILGRFICLYGQYKAIELSKLIIQESAKSELVNINTDGIYVSDIDENTILKIVEKDRDGYFKLGFKHVDKIIQVDVNNYITITNNKLKTKGSAFATGMKQVFTRFENKITVNMKNALTLIKNPDEMNLKYEPIYFHQKNKKFSTIALEGEESSAGKKYYLTNEKDGKTAIKFIAKPTVLSLDGEIMYFTDNIDLLDKSEYRKFAEITRDRILEFRLTDKDNLPYIQYKLKPDMDEKNISFKRKMRLWFNKLYPGLVCFNGFRGNPENVLTIDKKVIPELSNYNMTNILKSTEPMGISLKKGEILEFITTDNENTLTKLTDDKVPFSQYKDNKIFILKKEDVFNHEDVKIVDKEIIPVYTWDKEYDYKGG